jgi:hypothetical protein
MAVSHPAQPRTMICHAQYILAKPSARWVKGEMMRQRPVGTWLWDRAISNLVKERPGNFFADLCMPPATGICFWQQAWSKVVSCADIR